MKISETQGIKCLVFLKFHFHYVCLSFIGNKTVLQAWPVTSNNNESNNKQKNTKIFCWMGHLLHCSDYLDISEGGGGGGGERERGGYQDGPISAYNQLPFFCLISSPICLLYRVVHDFVQKALFSEMHAN